MKRVVILGGSGFIGRHLARFLVDRDFDVVIVDKRDPGETPGRWVRTDVSDPASLAKIIQPKDVVVHLIHSSIPAESMADPAAELKQNVIPYVSLLELLADMSVERIVYSSTGGQIYGNAEKLPLPEHTPERPISAYGAAKLSMEQFTRLITRRKGLPHLILRIGNPYGPYQELTNRHGVVPYLFRSVLHGATFTAFGGGETVRDYIYIEDAALAMARLIEAGTKNETVNVGTGAGTSLSELIGLVEKITGGKVKKESAPIRPFDVKANALDISLLKNLIDFSPEVSLEQGLIHTWEYIKENEKA